MLIQFTWFEGGSYYVPWRAVCALAVPFIAAADMLSGGALGIVSEEVETLLGGPRVLVGTDVRTGGASSDGSSVFKRPASNKHMRRSESSPQDPDAALDLTKESVDLPMGPQDSDESFKWARTYLGRLALKHGVKMVLDQFSGHKWVLDEYFTGVAGASIITRSIASAFQYFAKDNNMSQRDGFRCDLGVMADKDGNVQRYLKCNFPDRCLFADVNEFRKYPFRRQKYPHLEINFAHQCVTHGKRMCTITSQRSSSRLRVLTFGAPCVAHSSAGKRQKFADGRTLCHDVALQAATTFEYDIVMMENVTDYPMQQQCSRLTNFDWKLSVVDPRKYGHNMGRERVIAVGLNKETMEWSSPEPLDELMSVFESKIAEPSFTKMFFVMNDQQIHNIYSNWYNVSAPCEHSLSKTYVDALKQYQRSGKFDSCEMWDLTQLPDNDRGRASRTDGSMYTLTTNSSYNYSTVAKRIMMPEEGLNSMGVPCLARSAAAAHVPLMRLTDDLDKQLSYSAKIALMGNGWASVSEFEFRHTLYNLCGVFLSNADYS